MSTTDSTDSTAASTDNEAEPEELDYRFPWREAPVHKFDDVGGHDAMKETLERTVVRPICRDRERYERFDVPIPNVLLSGPPGTGKTYLAKALAGETRAHG